MAYYRTHWVQTTDLASVHEAVSRWSSCRAADIAGFAGVFAGNDVDDHDFNWVSIQSSEPTPFVGEGSLAVQALTDTIQNVLGRPITHRDSIDLTHVAPHSPRLSDSTASGDGGSCSMWFETTDVASMREIVDAWQRRHANEEEGLGESWLGKDLHGNRLFNVAAHFPTVAEMREGTRFFDELASELGTLLANGTERHCMRAPSLWVLPVR